MSRRGPTSVILHLPAVTAPGARFLYVGPELEVPRVPERLTAVGWRVLAEYRVSVRAWAPIWEDWATHCEWQGEAARREDWEQRAAARGLAYREERYVVLAGTS
ncbi:hypothetical protein [Deinococcus hopiensis]|uniref:hypothetical protein n=1 Tax=Deinococcus hopiensis TaxID=309885 RepID=UPI001FE51B10|nr:hypothetical protein [Deinococcus hopiensis]